MSEHVSVLLKEAIAYLDIKEDGIYVDATTGGAGHSAEILKRLKNGHLYCFDQDDYAFAKAEPRLKAIGSNYTFIKANFVNLEEELAKHNVFKIDGIIYDLGVSSFQLDTVDRGFSYRFDAPLDMRMDKNQKLSAYNIVNEYSVEELTKILFEYGEEPYAKSIAKAIEKTRIQKPITTTFELVDVIKSALPNKVLNKKGHPAKQTFQAIRIAVNDELCVLESSLNQALSLLNVNGRIVVITFHSLEDRICKKLFKERSTVFVPKGVPLIITEKAAFELVTKKPLLPSAEEINMNNRAHSAKLRVMKRVAADNLK